MWINISTGECKFLFEIIKLINNINDSCVIPKSNGSNIVVTSSNGIGRIIVLMSVLPNNSILYDYTDVSSRHNVNKAYTSLTEYKTGVTSYTIIAVGEGVISTSTDDGISWIDYTFGLGTVFFNSIYVNIKKCIFCANIFGINKYYIIGFNYISFI